MCDHFGKCSNHSCHVQIAPIAPFGVEVTIPCVGVVDKVGYIFNDHVGTKEFDSFIRVTAPTALQPNRGKNNGTGLHDTHIRVNLISGDRYKRVPLYSKVSP